MASSPLINHFQQQHHHHHIHAQTQHQCKQLYEKNETVASNLFAKDAKFTGLNRLNNGTPKRRLSYNTTTTISSTPSLMETSAISISLNQIPLTASCAASNNSSNRNVNLNFQNENSPLCPAKFSLRSGDDCGVGGVGARNDPDSGPNSTNTTPFIKRKCLQKELTSVHNSAIQQRSSNNSPYLISSVNLTNDANLLDSSSSHSPRHNTHHLNDSYEMMESCSSSTSSTSNKSSRNCRYLSRRLSQNAKLFNKHKSAPLSNISFSTLMNQHHNNQLQNEKQQQSSQTIDKSSGTESHPLNDISNHINTTTNKYTSSSSSAGSAMTNKLGEDMSFTDEQRDDVADLENLIFGNVTNGTTTTGTNANMNNKNENNTTSLDQQSFIKQSLDIDATHRNLIGDRTKQHILPIIQSNKHQDLHCISPETLVDVLNGNYSDQISECVIIDSRYPYEYDGGHIATALNLFTKEKLFEEMFIRRLNFKNSSIHKFTSSYSTDSLVTLANTDCMETNSGVVVDACNSSAKFAPPKRSIVIFHCEFSSERGPSLLRFLRNQDRSLNEQDYPNLYYPELYLLEGGYKSFYEGFKNFCQPQTYKPMLHAEHYEDLKHFRAKAKSWEASRHHILKCNENLQKKYILCHTKSEQGKLIEQQEPAHKVIKMRQKI